MKLSFRVKLSIVMIVFAIIITFTNTIIDHIRMTEHVIDNNRFQLQQIEELVTHSLQNIEKAYYFFDEDTTARMESATHYLINLYEEEPNVDEWDFENLQELLDVDIYMINGDYVITHSTFEEDIGLDFTECCAKLVQVLDERKRSGEFFADGMDVEQQTGAVKKYSYMVTPDRKYVIELGYSLENGAIFSEFNFLRVIEEIEQKYQSINQINILNMGGYTYGEPVEDVKLTTEQREAFEEALVAKETTELKAPWHDEQSVYRYVPYASEFDKSSTTNKVIEIVYNETQLETILAENQKAFIIQLIMALGVTILISLMISKWVSKPMYLAFHDSLTGLKNRAAFDDTLKKKLDENKGNLALMIIDLDNFKLVNDLLGHDVGDDLLKLVARKLQAIARTQDVAVRLGGDEFVIIMPAVTRDEVACTATKIIRGIIKSTAPFKHGKGNVTASIGVAMAPEHGKDLDSLYKNADLALYTSKEKGKNRYYIYDKIEGNYNEVGVGQQSTGDVRV